MGGGRDFTKVGGGRVRPIPLSCMSQPTSCGDGRFFFFLFFFVFSAIRYSLGVAGEETEVGEEETFLITADRAHTFKIPPTLWISRAPE